MAEPDDQVIDGEEPSALPPGLLKVFAQSQALMNKMMSDNAELDKAWKSGNVEDEISRLRAEAKADVDRLNESAKKEQKDVNGTD